MKVFVWERVSKCSGNYHEEGGVVVFAETLERAIQLANAQRGCSIKADEFPDDIRTIVKADPGEEAVYIMPDAGCC